MKIGIDIRTIKETTGIGNYVKGFLWGLSQLKNDQNQYFLYTDENIDLVETIHELSIYSIERKFHIHNFIMSELHWYYKVWQDIKKEQLDLFYSPHSTVFSFFPGIKTILMVHDLSAILFPQLHTLKVRILAGRFFLNHACKKAQFIIVPSQSTKNDLEKIIPGGKEKVQVIYNGLMNKIGTRHGASLQAELDRFSAWDFSFILYLGTIEPRKNLVRLIEAYHLLIQKDKNLPKLVIAGSKGWFYEEVYQKVKMLKLENQIIFTGRVTEEEKETLYSKALIFVFPSLYEGFGLPIAEAMLRDIPVLTSNISSLPEIVGKDYPFLVNPENVSDIKDKLKQLLKLTPKEKEKIVIDNKKKVLEYTWEKNAEKWLKVVSQN